MKKNKKIGWILPILVITLIYITWITSFPDSMLLFQGESLNVSTLLGIDLREKQTSYQTIQTAAGAENTLSKEIGKVDASLTLFNTIPIKDVSISVIPKATVIPVGDLVGLKLYTNGVLVVGMSEIEGKKPYENSDIKEGDMIVEIEDKAITCTADLIERVNQSNGTDLNLKFVREGDIRETSIKPVKTENNEYKIGLWVRDAAAGVGTMTFYEPETGMFAALGHGIVDIDTEKLIDIAKGEFVTADIRSIVKGEKGEPGKIQGSIEKQLKVGEVGKNTKFGVYGKLTNSAPLNINQSQKYEVASREEIQVGKATILCTLEDNVRKEYEIEIEKIFKNNNQDNKSMLIKVTDPELLEKTGGIIQGMSGSPILQNGKLVGAVTHVLVNDPTTGYGIFGDLMIKQLREVKSE